MEQERAEEICKMYIIVIFAYKSDRTVKLVPMLPVLFSLFQIKGNLQEWMNAILFIDGQVLVLFISVVTFSKLDEMFVKDVIDIIWFSL